MVDSNLKLACKMPASAFLDAVKDYSNNISYKSQKPTFKKLTPLAKKMLYRIPIYCYVPADKIGKSRVISGVEAEHILGHVQHIDNIHHLAFLKSISHNELESITLDITIMPYNNNDLLEEFSHMMFLGSIIQTGSRSGKIDYGLLEERFRRILPKRRRISDYIERAQKFSYAKLLNISPRSISLQGGGSDELK